MAVGHVLFIMPTAWWFEVDRLFFRNPNQFQKRGGGGRQDRRVESCKREGESMLIGSLIIDHQIVISSYVYSYYMILLGELSEAPQAASWQSAPVRSWH